jgi:hypothetical protein
MILKDTLIINEQQIHGRRYYLNNEQDRTNIMETTSTDN